MMERQSIFPLQDFRAFLKERKTLDESTIKEIIDFMISLMRNNSDKILNLEEYKRECEQLLNSARETLNRLRIQIEELR